MILLRILAAVVAALGVLPLWRMLPGRATGLAGAATVDAAASYSALMWNGLLLALIPALLVTMWFDPQRFEASLRRLVSPLARISSVAWAATCALIATGIAGVVAVVVLDGQPTLIDSFAQLTQARYFAAGRLAGPVLPGQEFWHIQQTIVTAHGWVSQYPPGYIALLAVGLVLHAVQWVGPVMLGVAVFFSALIADEVFESRSLARVASLLAAVSPFMLGLAGAYMSHVPACAFSAAALYFALRAQRGSARWVLAAGLAIGALFTVRPLTGVVAGVVASGYAALSPIGTNAKVKRISLALAAALPFLLLVGWYNAHFFGHATTFGYSAALGPHAGLGFGYDPWGNRFGPLESLAYTSAELAALNVALLEVPLPLLLLVGVYFAAAHDRTVSRSQLLLFMWAAALVCADFFYWHHGLFMGPRMLADAGTLWVLLAVLSVAGLIARIRADWYIAEKYSVRVFALGGAVVAVLAGLLWLAPDRLLSYAPGHMASLLEPPAAEPSALVFVHGGWTSRVAMRLAGHGMRLDSVETVLRQNGTCAAHNFSLAYARGQRYRHHIVLSPIPQRPTRELRLAPGDRMRMAEGDTIDAGCAREMASDTAGVVDVTPYVWQADLPGLSSNRALFVRDMGPAENAQLIAQLKARTPYMLQERAGRMTLVPYAPAMQDRWGGAP